MLGAAPWAGTLPAALRQRVLTETVVRQAPAGSLVCRKGESVEHWIGVVDGLVKMARTRSTPPPGTASAGPGS